MRIAGFVDLQVNGYLGVDFSAPGLTSNSARTACAAMLATGTAAMLPTVITSPPDVYEANLPILAGLIESDEFAGRLLGIHLEGPFISPEPGAVGAHNPRWVRPCQAEHLQRLLDFAGGHVRLLTLAPERDGADDLARLATSRGVTVSLGHCLARPDDLARLASAGAKALTHFGNGLPNTIHRHHNPLWAGLANDDLTAMIITDGHHLPPPFIRSVLRAKGVARTVVVSDAACLAGLPPGNYSTPDNECVLEPSGLLHNPAKQCLVGSSATMLQCMNHLASLGELSAEELLAVGFANPLGLIDAADGDLRASGEVRYDESARAFTFHP